MRRVLVGAFSAAALAIALSPAWAGDPDAKRGERVFGACAACHSLEPNRNMTGPTLADLWNRKAGGLAGFPRYSSALKSSGVTWNDKTLDEWIKDPQRVVPGNEMTFQGIKDDQPRRDLLAVLKDATKPGHKPAQSAQKAGQMGGMMGGGVLNLKQLEPEERVEKITHCGDTYRVTTGDGKTRAFWERNLRLKTDSSGDGPQKGVPALTPAGMMGDRADVIFAAPDEISGFIKSDC